MDTAGSVFQVPQSRIGPGGGIGRRSRLKIYHRKVCGFDPHPGHHVEREELSRERKANKRAALMAPIQMRLVHHGPYPAFPSCNTSFFFDSTRAAHSAHRTTSLATFAPPASVSALVKPGKSALWFYSASLRTGNWLFESDRLDGVRSDDSAIPGLNPSDRSHGMTDRVIRESDCRLSTFSALSGP